LIIFIPCQFTNFIASSANATAKSLSVQWIGKPPGVRTAAQRNCPRNFPPSPPPERAKVRPAKAAAIVAAAVVTRIELFWQGGTAAPPCRRILIFFAARIPFNLAV
jgi:hypothetical protein